ncbi:hypothetical protein AXX17_AT5G59050 [Arabidopsis thaliana]|uniref:Protein kinase domain-containing protein n=1 Tax=Arabidopsis thaliana TaxID=3702 RepID=A0A178URC1_ARATH|nr:hypothetical protein AXX17_AT5G59050 [Arabidopsis thaliana]
MSGDYFPSFISLDCGLPANELSPYDEPTTGLRFLSDEKFIQSGKAGRIKPNSEGYLKPYETLRYFPDGIRNCYNLNVEKGITHLIRAYFIYGNYDGLDINPKFDLFQLRRTNRSTLPPLLNAFEVYTVIQFPQIETNENDVVAVQNIKTTYEISRNSWQGDPCVPRQFMWEGLNCSDTDMSTPPKITSLNLSSSGLTGSIAAAIQNLTQLETLPQGNPRLCLSGSCLPSKRKPFPVAIVASVASVAIIIITVLVLIFLFRKKKPSTVGALQRPPSISPAVNVTYPNSSEPSIQTNKRRFTYSEVIDMTNNFQRVVGEGGFGIVYHGTLNGNAQVAVKVLSQSSTQGYKQFKAEVDLLMRVHHTNLVSLVGYCGERDHLALIYEFVPNGNLRQHMSGKGGRSNINWGIRLRIAVEAALGLEYLHSGCIPPMIHRDVKTTNIFLDEQFKAKLADFGLSRSFPDGGDSHVSTVIVGTPGYLDPEYYRTSRLTEKSDVYSFGIVLLEMITNEPVIDQARAKTHITEWVGFELNSGDISSIMDPNLHGDYDSRSAWRALELAMSCANPSSTRRPSMSQVVIELKECLVSENSRRNMSRGMESQSSAEVNIIFDTALQIVNRVIKSVLISLPKMADLSPEIRRPLKEMRLKILSDSWPEGNSQFMIWLKIL